MIVAITGPQVSVSVDDELESYSPTRTAELVRHCLHLYRQALTDVESVE